MKITIPKIKKNFKKKKSEINPNIFWNYLLYITSALIILSFAFGFYVFFKTNNESGGSADDESVQANTVKKERIDKVLQFFSDREQRSFGIQTSPAGVVDPSL